ICNMEKLLQYCWKHRILPEGELRTADGESIEIVDTGLLNTDAGPDFFNARLRIGDRLLAGNVEIHVRRNDWYAHGHDRDAAYDNVILHVVDAQSNGPADADSAIRTREGRILPEVKISVPEEIRANYRELLSEDSYPPCYKIIPNVTPLSMHSWMAALQTERLKQKTEAIAERVSMLKGDWEHAYFITLARSYGFGSNSDALEQWARNMPMTSVAHHRDNLFQIESIFFGQAGMLNIASVRERLQLETAADEYFQRMQSEYEYLKHKFQMTDKYAPQWKYMRMRPQNFPTIRIAQLARLYYERRTSLSQLIECDTIDKLRKMFHCGVSDYWQTHYTFGHESQPSAKQLSAASISLLMINCAIPMIFAYGRQTGSEALCNRALDLLESLPPENNTITRMWQQVGLESRSAGDTQALIQLKKQYCDRKDCLQCRIGYEYMKLKS
ncbi:MAG: DUF2851 family protein, partial [Prevotella sp.]|nr:DUF2851 family protein [Prevotella sp.]